jgi:hypothetical protein
MTHIYHLIACISLVHSFGYSSKALLLQYVQSKKVIDVIGITDSQTIVTFLRKNVFPHEQHYARCYYLQVRALDAYSNSVIEGTNNAAKHSDHAVKPNMSLAKALSCLTTQDKDKLQIQVVAYPTNFTRLHSLHPNKDKQT